MPLAPLHHGRCRAACSVLAATTPRVGSAQLRLGRWACRRRRRWLSHGVVSGMLCSACTFSLSLPCSQPLITVPLASCIRYHNVDITRASLGSAHAECGEVHKQLWKCMRLHEAVQACCTHSEHSNMASACASFAISTARSGTFMRALVRGPLHLGQCMQVRAKHARGTAAWHVQLFFVVVVVGLCMRRVWSRHQLHVQ
jgi:hypothetical protein